MPSPASPKIYHIAHVDRLASIVRHGHIWSDAIARLKPGLGTNIGITKIKNRRQTLFLASHEDLMFGSCVPFNFCPRSVMLYLLHRGNHEDLEYRGGQAPIVHLEADLHSVVNWAGQHGKRWAVTLSNAGSGYFEDRADLAGLQEIDWEAVDARIWNTGHFKERKQAEFLLEEALPWQLIDRTGVLTPDTYTAVMGVFESSSHRPHVESLPDWYY